MLVIGRDVAALDDESMQLCELFDGFDGGGWVFDLSGEIPIFLEHLGQGFDGDVVLNGVLGPQSLDD
jgi:hypothetical protein